MMVKVNELLQINCDTLEEVENYIKENTIIPDVIVISEKVFNRNKTYKGTCNEFFENWKVNNYEIPKLEYEFRVTNGSHYMDGEYKVNSYNFIKNQPIN